MTFRSKMLAVAILLLSPKSLPAQEQAVKADTIRHSEHYTDDRGREFVRFWYEPLAMDARFVPEMRVEKEGEGKRLTVRSGSYSIDATKSAGSISYSESVSPGGAQILSVPIETVPVPSILPQMALVYNSQSGNGLAGYGWGLSGLSAITVTSKSIYYDGTAAPVDLDSPSTLSFSLDGVRLVPNTTPGMTDYQYVTAQGFIYVKKVTVDSGAGAGNIRYFEALYPNGNRAVFGYTSNQLTKWNYPLTSITDHRGYRIDIDYMADGGVYYVQSVGYGGRTTGTHPAYLHFTYQSRSDKVTAYLSSSPICQGKILTGITSYNSGTAVRSYSLTHELQYGFNQLTSLSCSSGNSSLNPLHFEYGTEGSQRSTFFGSFYSSFSVPVVLERGHMQKATFSDGTIIYPASVREQIYGVTVQTSGGAPVQYGSLVPPNQAILVYPNISSGSTSAYTLYAGSGFQVMRSVDIDGDGLDEVVKVNFGSFTSTGVKLNILRYSYKDGTQAQIGNTLSVEVDGNFSISGYQSPVARTYYFGDFNRDGRAEMVTLSSDATPYGSRTSRLVMFSLATGAKLCDVAVSGLWGRAIVGLDADGDGKTDLLTFSDSGYTVYSYNGNTFSSVFSGTDLQKGNVLRALPGDFNGDGLADFLEPPECSYQDIREVQLAVWCPASCPVCGGSEPVNDEVSGLCRHCGVNLKRYYVDHASEAVCRKCGSALQIETHGSGKIFDAIFTCPTHGQYATVQVDYGYVDNGSDWTIWYSTGKGFQSATSTLVRSLRSDKYQVADYDRDGYSDLVSVSGSTLKVYRTVSGALQPSPVASIGVGSGVMLMEANLVNPGYYGGLYYLKSNHYIYQLSGSETLPATRQMSGMTDGFGNRHVYEHRGIDDISSTVYEEGTASHAYPYATVYVPITVLGYRSVQEPSTGQYVTKENYRFIGPPLVHRTGLGYCGFAGRIVTDLLSGARRTETYDQEMFGVPLSVTTEVGDVPISSSAYTWQRNDGANRVANPRMVSSSQTDYLKGATESGTYAYDAYNNPTSVTVSQGSALTTQTSITYSNTVTPSLYLTGLPLIKTVTRTRDGSMWTDKESVTYNSNNLPESRINYTGISGNQKTGETRWTYDAYGNVLSKSYAPYSSTTFTGTSYTYDSAGRYLQTSTNALGETTSYSAYDKHGQATSISDFRNRTTTITYDDWGRKTGENRPDGTSVHLEYGWTESSNPTHHYERRSETGKPVTIRVLDASGRAYRSGTQRFDGKWQFVEKVYADNGLVWKESLPYRETGGVPSTKYWNVYSYDDYLRPESLVEASGKTTTWSYDGLSTTEVREGVTSTKTRDASGALIRASDAGGTIAYTLRPDGQIATISAPGGVVTTLSYDVYGRRSSIADPSAGTRTESWTYSADGASTHVQTNANGTVTSNKDRYGRLTSVVRGTEGTATYSYNSYNQLTQISMTNGTKTEYTYDNYDRLSSVKETLPGNKWLQKEYTYASGNVSTVKYTSQNGVITTESYAYTNGYNTGISITGGITVWQLTGENDLGQPTAVTTGTVSRTYSYTSYGMPTGRTMGAVMNVGYSFDVGKGNLTSRTDNTRSLTESFTYDGLNRLVGMSGRSVTYAGNGNITAIGGVGSFSYGDASHPYRVTGYTPASGSSAVQFRDQTVTYSATDRPLVLSEGGRSAAFTYNAAGDRAMMEISDSSGEVLTRYYAGGRYELDHTSSSTTERLYLGGDAYSAPVVYQKTGSGSWTLYNIGRDYQGSITHIATAGGTLVAEYSYDPWGRMRSPADQTLYAAGSEPDLLLGRGYTGHEHLLWFGLVNMNARLYDPALGRFLSPDPYVQAPDFTQNFNRYSYALNNPLKYSDQSGEFVMTTAFVIGCIIGGAAIIGGTINVLSNLDNINGFWQGVTTALSGAIGGAGVAAAGIFSGGGALILAGAGAGALTSFNNSIVAQTGKNFIGIEQVDWDVIGKLTISGAVAGAVSAYAGSYVSTSFPLWFNNGTFLTSPIEKAVASSLVASAAGHVVGGTTYGLLAGESLADAFFNSLDGIGQSMAMGVAIGVSSTLGTCLFQGINPFDGMKAFPPENGFKGAASDDILEPGTVIDRYGGPDGRFAAPEGTGFSERGLPLVSKAAHYHRYLVMEPIPVQRGTAAGSFWFASPGGGTQFFFANHSIQYYINNGYLLPL